MQTFNKMLLSLSLIMVAGPVRAEDQFAKVLDVARQHTRASYDYANLFARYSLAKAQLADLEKNAWAMNLVGTPAKVSPLRTTYAVGNSIVDLALGTVAFKYMGLLMKQGKVARERMAAKGTADYGRNIARYRREMRALQRKVLVGRGSVRDVEQIRGYRSAINTDLKIYRGYAAKNNYTVGKRLARGTGITLAAGVMMMLIADGIHTWVQVTNDDLTVDQQKQNLREFIARAESELGLNSTPSVR